MGIVTTYTRATREGLTSNTKGSFGTLRSTRQKPPYVTGPYRTTRIFNDPVIISGKYIHGANAHVKTALDGVDGSYGMDKIDQKSLETARARLNNRLIKGRAALGITAATANQSFAMIAKRVSTLRNAYKALRTGNVKKLERTLGLQRSVDGQFKELRFSKRRLPPKIVRHFNAQAQKARKRKRIAKWEKPQDVWLEYTFGWMPLIADVQAVLEVKSDPFEVARSFGTCTLTTIGEISGLYGKSVLRKKTKTVCTAGIRITNPNLALNTQLGLSNPLLVAWDIIPFSFVVDWFFKVSTFLSRFNDMAGFSYVDPVTTVTKEVLGISTRYSYPGTMGVAKGRLRERTKGIVNKPAYPRFRLPTPDLWLATTSTALALQQFSKR